MADVRAPTASSFSYAAYLDAKRSVDDRALNRHVIDVLVAQLSSAPQPVRVLEIGGGIGTMVARLSDWGVLRRAHYTLLDVDRQTLDDAPRWLEQWSRATRRTVSTEHDVLRIEGGDPCIDFEVRFVAMDLHAYLESRGPDDFGLLIANAFLDLVDVPAVVPALLDRLAPHGLYWFSINFDGETVFMPAHAADRQLIEAYHRSMDERTRAGRPAGDRHAGRHLFQHLPDAGATILASGSSDWVLHAVDGMYPGREAIFIEHILRTIDAELNWRTEIDQTALRDWLAERRAQLDAGALVYIAHQLDFVGRRLARAAETP